MGILSGLESREGFERRTTRELLQLRRMTDDGGRDGSALLLLLLMLPLHHFR